jgi:hypothetical protein
MPELKKLVAEELAVPVDAPVTAMAEVIAAQHGKASRAVLFYGSCLREKQLEGLMLDFYLIVSDYRAAYDKSWLAAANRMIPPNVFYFEHGGLVAKYAVLSEADFARECTLKARTSSVFARFAQPSRLVWAASHKAREAAIAAISRAAPTLLAITRPIMTDEAANDLLALWKTAFDYSFGAELRAERNSRPELIVDADPDRYRRFGAAAGYPVALRLDDDDRHAGGRNWNELRRRGKRASVLRLAKASLTFAGGADYIVWKINRHAGTDIKLKPWQQRHPLLAGISLLPRLLRSGAVR